MRQFINQPFWAFSAPDFDCESVGESASVRSRRLSARIRSEVSQCKVSETPRRLCRELLKMAARRWEGSKLLISNADFLVIGPDTTDIWRRSAVHAAAGRPDGVFPPD
jgi:hypothetical protein